VVRRRTSRGSGAKHHHFLSNYVVNNPSYVPNNPWTIPTSGNGTQTLPGICPLLTPSRGSGATPSNLRGFFFNVGQFLQKYKEPQANFIRKMTE
jgi:hypothetical protein